MNYNQTQNRRTLRLSFLLACVFFLTACGSGEGPPTGPGTNTGSIAFKLVWQNVAPTAHEGPLNGNPCEDYAIDDIDAVITDKDNKEEAEGSWSCEARGGTIKDVKEGTGYTITVIGLVAGNADWQGSITDFTVIRDTVNVPDPPIKMNYYGDDTTPPTVNNHYPGVGDTNIFLNSVISADFSENIAVSTINASSCILKVDGDSAPVPSVLRYDAASQNVTMEPNNKLKPNAKYTVTITSAVEDMAGLHLVSKKWTFTTGEADGEHLKWNVRQWNASLWN